MDLCTFIYKAADVYLQQGTTWVMKPEALSALNIFPQEIQGHPSARIQSLQMTAKHFTGH